MPGAPLLTANPGPAWTPPSAPARRKLVVIMGQSNAVGTGRVTNLTAGQAHYANRYPFPYRMRKGNDSNPPDFVHYDWADLEPHIGTNGLNLFGIELSLARALEAAAPQEYALMTCAHSSTGLASEWLNGWPSADPDGLSVVERANEMIADALATYPWDLEAFAWIQGEADASSEAASLAYDENLPTLAALFPSAPWVYGRLHANASLATMPYRDTLRASQLALDAVAGFHMVDQDSFTLGADSVHYNETGLLELGEAYAAVLLAL